MFVTSSYELLVLSLLLSSSAVTVLRGVLWCRAAFRVSFGCLRCGVVLVCCCDTWRSVVLSGVVRCRV
eukprot:3700380-Lingulodinium_polyedra.AAC.1